MFVSEVAVMNASRVFAPFAATAALVLSGGAAVAGPHSQAAPQPPPPVHMSTSTFHPMHVLRMRPFLPPKPVVFGPSYVPLYLPYWQGLGGDAFSLIGLGSLANRCAYAMPQTLGDLGASASGFAPVALGTTPAFDSLGALQPLGSPANSTPQNYCQQPAIDWSGLNLGF
jgi:hypothetical protein